MSEPKHPWDVGPTELISFALEHMHGGSDFNRRLSFLILDVGVETLLKTFLSLPARVTGAVTSYTKKQAAIDGSFNDLINGISEAIPKRIEVLNLDYVMFYHGIRNTLYHQGTTVGTVTQYQLTGYAQLAVRLLKELLDIDLSAFLEAPAAPEREVARGEITLQAVRNLLTRIRIPAGQLELYTALMEAGERGVTARQLERITGRDAANLSGVLGALGNRIKNTEGFESRPDINAVLEILPAEDGGWRYRMRPLLRQALEAEQIFEIYNIDLGPDLPDSANGRTARDVFYLDFFESLSSEYWRSISDRGRPKPQPHHWYSFGAGKSGIRFAWAFRSRGRFAVELYIDAGSESAQNIAILNQLKTAIGSMPGELEGLDWEELPDARACRIVLYRAGKVTEIAGNAALKREIIDWGIRKMRTMERTFREPIGDL